MTKEYKTTGLNPWNGGLLETDQIILKEIRSLKGQFDDLSLQIRIDTPWQRFRGHIRYAIHTINEIPLPSRICLFFAGISATIAFAFTVPGDIKKKLLFACVDLILFAITLIGLP